MEIRTVITPRSSEQIFDIRVIPLLLAYHLDGFMSAKESKVTSMLQRRSQ